MKTKSVVEELTIIRDACDRLIALLENGADIQAASTVTTFSQETKISKFLIRIGIKGHLKGFRCIREALVILIENEGAIEDITTVLYPTVGKKINATSTAVERCIRHAIEIAWENSNDEFWTGFSERPINSEFLAMARMYLVAIE